MKAITTTAALAQVWLARSLAATGPALRALIGDPEIVLVPGSVMPSQAELHAAAAVIERAADCLRVHPGRCGAAR